ncbi:MAG: S-layer homology domain-containing protein [Abditibacteriota bacterium]|nr:S-layer homology domain-containing protein [Abditibacteriota bacterium]
MKHLTILAALLVLAAPLCAQSAFSDLPRDHWAYDAVSELEDLGLVIGYPDGEFKGKRTLTRYEFAMVIARLLPLLTGEEQDLSGYARKSDLEPYALRDGVKRGDIIELSLFADTGALSRLQALIDEFAPELAALDLDVDLLKADVGTLKRRAAQLEEEQARIKVTGTANFMVQGVIGGDSPAIDYDARYPVEKMFRRHQAYYKDVQIDIRGRVNDHVNVFTTLVMTDLMDKDINREARYDTFADIVPYYLYAVSTDEKWGQIRVGRMPFQINNYVFSKGTENASFNIERLDDHNFAMEGFDYSKDFGALDVRLWGNRPVYDWNERKLFYIGGEKISANGGAQLGLDMGGARFTAVYDRLAAENRVPFVVDKIDYYGATAHVPFGEFFTDGGWFRMKPNKGVKAADWWDAALGYDNGRLSAKAGYKTVENNYDGLSCADKIFYTVANNYKGWFAEGSYRFGEAFTLNGAYKRYKANDPALRSRFHDLKYAKGELIWTVSPLDRLSAKYERGDYRYSPVDREADIKREAWTAAWNRKVGDNAKIKLLYQYVKYGNTQASHIVAGQLTVGF